MSAVPAGMDPHRELVLDAVSEAEFLALLREILARSGRTAGQVSAFTGLPRSTCYRLEVPADLDVHLICDNYGTHKHPTVRKWPEAHPRFPRHSTPTHSSWLNQVERWFGLLTDKRLRRAAHKSLRALENDIRDWIKTWNEDPRPFVWTKDADEILDRLASYLDRIPGAGH